MLIPRIRTKSLFVRENVKPYDRGLSLPGIWLVIRALSVVFASGCSTRPQKNIQFVDFGETESSCNRLTDNKDRNRVASVALNYFMSNVGADVKEVKIGNISKCEQAYVVPVVAIVPPEIGWRPWYVDIKKKDMTPAEFGRPE